MRREIQYNNDEEPEYKPPKKYFISRSNNAVPKLQSEASKLEADVLEVIENWKNPYEWWALTLSSAVLSVPVIPTGYFINRHFRDTLVLLNSGKISSYVIMLWFPAFSTAMMHYIRVSNRIFSNKEKCPICTQVRATAIQVSSAVIYPCVIAPLINFPLASRQKSYSLPKITKEKPFRVLNYLRQLYKPIFPTLMYIAAFHAFLSMGVTYFEQNFYYYKVLPEVKSLRMARSDNEQEEESTESRQGSTKTFD